MARTAETVADKENLKNKFAGIFSFLQKERQKSFICWIFSIENHALHLDKIFKKCPNFFQLLQHGILPREENAISSMFQCKTIYFNCGLRCAAYFGDPVDLAKRKISQSTFIKTFKMAPKHSIIRSHSLNSDISMKVVTAVQNTVKENTSSSVSWKLSAEDREQSFVCLLQG